MFMEKITQKITTREQLLAISRTDTAKAIDVDISVISRILSPDPSQRRIPNIHTLKKLAVYLNLSLDQLYSLLELDKNQDKSR